MTRLALKLLLNVCVSQSVSRRSAPIAAKHELLSVDRHFPILFFYLVLLGVCPITHNTDIYFCPFFFQIITAKIGPVNNSRPSSPDSSSDSSTASTPATFDGPNLEAENCLPGVVSKAVWCLPYHVIRVHLPSQSAPENTIKKKAHDPLHTL